MISGGTTGYLLTPSGEVLSGPTTGGGWHPDGSAPCTPGASPASAQLAAGPKLVLACDTAAASGSSAVTVYTSASGTAWQRAGTVTVGGTVDLARLRGHRPGGAGDDRRHRVLG